MNKTGKGTFKKGESGNPGGRPKTKLFRDTILRKIEEGSDPMELVDALWAEAKNGNVQAIKEIREIVDGKTPQPISGDEENPLFTGAFKIEWGQEKS